MSANSSFTSGCYNSVPAQYINHAYCLAKLLLVTPFVVLVLFLGVWRWRRQQQGCLPPTSHSDVFTYHVSVLELVNLLGYVLYYWGKFGGSTKMAVVGEILLSVTFFGPLVFHIVACVDRYLAVVYPITYLRLRRSVGIKMQVISTVSAWLLSSGMGIFTFLKVDRHFVLISVVLAIFLAIISTFSIRILCALKHRGSDRMGVREDRRKVSQPRQRAASMVMAITGTLWMWFFGMFFPMILMYAGLQSHEYGCLVVLVGFWFSLPGNLVLPLLYLRKFGKRK